MTHLASLARLLPERDPHEDIYEMLERTLDDFDDIGEAAIHLIKFELAMLTELGFGLDLENCAATGATTDLIYVSPKSGGAVSRQAGDPWRDRLLRLPAFLREGGGGANGWSDQDLQDGFAAHRNVPAAPRAGTARAGPFRRPRRVYQCGDEASGEGAVRSVVTELGRSGERRDETHTPRAPSIGAVAHSRFLATNTCGYGSLRSPGRRKDGADCPDSRLARFTPKV